MLIDIDAFIPSLGIEANINGKKIKLLPKTARYELIYQHYAIEANRINKVLEEDPVNKEAIEASSENYNYLVENLASKIMKKSVDEILDNYSTDQISTLIVLWMTGVSNENKSDNNKTSPEGSENKSKKK